mmetsp:Transcript_26335/g.86512  ORF Transcript_26335/g.86512 Transcript_26335/m.86512 type:complete len:112 (+) Transcript_26335:462-797(+)
MISSISTAINSISVIIMSRIIRTNTSTDLQGSKSLQVLLVRRLRGSIAECRIRHVAEEHLSVSHDRLRAKLSQVFRRHVEQVRTVVSLAARLVNNEACTLDIRNRLSILPS